MITYKIDTTPPIDALHALYCEAGWIDANFPVQKLALMLSRSWRSCSAWDGERLVGFMRALSDGISDAYLLDLIVTADYRHQGIGRNIVRKLAGSLRADGVDWTVLIAAPNTAQFYSRLDAKPMVGFAPFRL